MFNNSEDLRQLRKNNITAHMCAVKLFVEWPFNEINLRSINMNKIRKKNRHNHNGSIFLLSYY